MRMTVAEIYLDNFSFNIAQIKKHLKHGVKMCVAVKANAYGHGAVRCAKTALECGVEYLCVATIKEGAELRCAGIECPILVLSLCSPNEMDDLAKYNLSPLAGDNEYIELLEIAAKKNAALLYQNKMTVHLAVDTGMGRIGCAPASATVLAKKIARSPFLLLGGVCTHFASADETSAKFRAYAKKQHDAFCMAVDSIRREKIDPGIVHCSSSAALLDHEDWQFDMVRPGIIAYGYYPGRITKKYLEKKGCALDLKPVMALVTGVSAIRDFEKGQSVSYGCEWTFKKNAHVAVLPIGYADGLLRRGANTLKIAINGVLCPVRGRICMDQCMAEIKSTSCAKRFERAVIFGPKESGALQNANDLAKLQNTIPYEILTCISNRVERVYK